MRRLHGIEIEDQPWCPRLLRDFATDYLELVIARSQVYRPIAARLSTALAHTQTDRIVDLCSGGGGPWATLLPALRTTRPALSLTFTDRFPNAATAARLQAVGAFYPAPADARAVPETLVGFRTLFSSFHHFAPDDARAILSDAVRGGEGIGVFEATRRHPLSLAGMLLSPLAVWAVTPMIRPFRWSRLLLTYLLPLAPLLILFDGIVSCLRTYTPGELQQLTEAVPGGENYDWEIGVAPARTGPLTYLIGVPRHAGE